MKKIIIALTALFTMTVSANAMSYEQARDQALFLTDKMAYELNLTEDQYEAAYEINLDYLLSIEDRSDLYGVYWNRRNLDLSYILLDWQYQAYCAASYFYRPLYWDAGFWHFGIYARYPHRSYFYFGRPHFYLTYHGGHSWHMNGGRSWYYGRTFGAPHRSARDMHGFGMRNGLDRGDFRNHSGNFARREGSRGLERTSPSRGMIDRNGNRSMGMNRSNTRSVQPGNSRSSIGSGSTGSSSMGNSHGTFGGNRSSAMPTRPSSTRTTTPSRTDTRSNFSTPSRTFGGSRSSSTPSRSSVSTPSRSSGSVSAPTRSSSSSPSSAPSRSSVSHSSGGSSHSGGGSSNGGGHFGGRR